MGVVSGCGLSLQEFGFSELGEMQFEEDLCLDVSSSQVGGRVRIYACHGLGGNQKWLYTNQVRLGACLYPCTR